MHIELAEIPESGVELTVEDDSWWPDEEYPRQKPVVASLLIQKKGIRYLLSGKFQTVVLSTCDRCLEDFFMPLDADFFVVFEFSNTGHEQTVRDHICSSDEMDVSYLDEPIIPISDVLREQAYLALPLKALCNEGCCGFCSKCGVNLNKEPCKCKGVKNSPFSVLGSLIR